MASEACFDLSRWKQQIDTQIDGFFFHTALWLDTGRSDLADFLFFDIFVLCFAIFYSGTGVVGISESGWMRSRP